MRFTNRMTSLDLSTGSNVRSYPKKQACGVETTQIYFQNPAKVLQNFRNLGAPCATKLRALGQRALRKSHIVAEDLSEVGSACVSE